MEENLPNWSFLALVEGAAADQNLPAYCAAFDVLLPQSLGQDSWSAIWISEQKPSIFSNARAASAKALLRYQQALELFDSSTKLLAGNLAATVAEGERVSASAALAAHADMIAPQLAAYGGRRQFQVALSWHVPDVLAYAQAQMAIVPQAVVGGSAMMAAKPSSEAELVAEVDKLLANSRADVDSLFKHHIAPVVQEQSLLPYDGHSDGLRRVLMINAADEDKLFAAFEAFDAEMFVPAKIQLAGPLPAISFAHLTVVPHDMAQVQAAERQLGLDDDYSAADVDSAYKKTLFTVHEDVVGVDHASAQSDLGPLQAARQLLKANAAAKASAQATGQGTSSYLWQVVRAGDTL